ncbi:MAG TPA: ROK family protein [Solirubrobacteraceae bacterium]|nr:ROK family protein [Solirubrobacteraceae bacterium]
MSLIGVDLGGTKCAAALYDDGVLGEPLTVATDTSSSGALVDQLVDTIGRLRGPHVEAIGVGIPSVVEFATGMARSGVNVPLEGVPLRTLLRERLKAPVYVDNDATCAALAEAHEDGRLVSLNLVMITVGTGVGGGIVLGGNVYRGATGAAGELGHTLIGANLSEGAPPAGDFPQRGSLEQLAAGRELDRLAQQTAHEHPDSALGRRAAEGTDVLGRDAVDAAHAGDEAAIRALRILGERLGIGIANAINTFDPEVVAIAGGAAAAGELLLAPARETARAYVVHGVGEQTEIRLARHADHAGLLGAALMAGQELAKTVSDSRGGAR